MVASANPEINTRLRPPSKGTARTPDDRVQRVRDLAPWLDAADLRRLSALAHHVALDGSSAVVAADLPFLLMDVEGRRQ
jgi:hypothetical protein